MFLKNSDSSFDVGNLNVCVLCLLCDRFKSFVPSDFCVIKSNNFHAVFLTLNLLQKQPQRSRQFAMIELYGTTTSFAGVSSRLRVTSV